MVCYHLNVHFQGQRVKMQLQFVHITNRPNNKYPVTRLICKDEYQLKYNTVVVQALCPTMDFPNIVSCTPRPCFTPF